MTTVESIDFTQFTVASMIGLAGVSACAIAQSDGSLRAHAVRGSAGDCGSQSADAPGPRSPFGGRPARSPRAARAPRPARVIRRGSITSARVNRGGSPGDQHSQCRRHHRHGNRPPPCLPCSEDGRKRSPGEECQAPCMQLQPPPARSTTSLAPDAALALACLRDIDQEQAELALTSLALPGPCTRTQDH